MAFGPAMPVTEARRLLRDEAAPVVAEGRLIGIVRRRALVAAPVGGEVASVAEDPVSVRDDESIDAVGPIAAIIDPVPVVDADGRLRGVIRR